MKNHTALQEEGETVVSITSSGKKKLSTYPTQRNLNQLVVVVHCPINALAQKEWKWWVWFLFALRYSDWKRRLTSRDSNLGSVLFQYFYFDSHFRIVTESGRWSKKSKLQKDLFFFTCQYQVFTFKLLLHNKCFAYIPTFELLLSLYISNLKLLSSVTTPESFELRSYDLLINAHLPYLPVLTSHFPYKIRMNPYGWSLCDFSLVESVL